VRRGIAALALSLAALPASAQAIAASELMQRLRDVASSEVRFTETRESALLKAPLVTAGRLVWRRPDRLEKHVEKPFAESTVIEGTRVTMTRPGDKGSRTVPVPAGPAQALVEALRATLAGDLAALERHFDVRVAGTTGAWTLTLLPRDAAVSAYVTRVDIAGSDARLGRIDVLEASGDRSTTLVEGAAR
jgi:outer membrane lipoprotein-sorting protein